MSHQNAAASMGSQAVVDTAAARQHQHGKSPDEKLRQRDLDGREQRRDSTAGSKAGDAQSKAAGSVHTERGQKKRRKVNHGKKDLPLGACCLLLPPIFFPSYFPFVLSCCSSSRPSLPSCSSPRFIRLPP